MCPWPADGKQSNRLARPKCDVRLFEPFLFLRSCFSAQGHVAIRIPAELRDDVVVLLLELGILLQIRIKSLSVVREYFAAPLLLVPKAGGWLLFTEIPNILLHLTMFGEHQLLMAQVLRMHERKVEPETQRKMIPHIQIMVNTLLKRLGSNDARDVVKVCKDSSLYHELWLYSFWALLDGYAKGMIRLQPIYF